MADCRIRFASAAAAAHVREHARVGELSRQQSPRNASTTPAAAHRRTAVNNTGNIRSVINCNHHYNRQRRDNEQHGNQGIHTHKKKTWIPLEKSCDPYFFFRFFLLLLANWVINLYKPAETSSSSVAGGETVIEHLVTPSMLQRRASLQQAKSLTLSAARRASSISADSDDRATDSEDFDNLPPPPAFLLEGGSQPSSVHSSPASQRRWLILIRSIGFWFEGGARCDRNKDF